MGATAIEAAASIEAIGTSETVFRAMGSDAHLVVVGGHDGVGDRMQAEVARLEGLWSRFQPTSEVSRLTERSGEWVEVSTETRLLVERSVEAWRLTGGSFDPTVLGDVIRAGYDSSFDEVQARPHRGRSSLLIGCTDIAVDGSSVRLPADTGFDPGGIGKGLAADLVVALAQDAGVQGICVNLGGDLRVWGRPPTGRGWTIGVGHEWIDGSVVELGLSCGAVATSTTLRRRWEVDGVEQHHLIDPATGRPSDTDLTSVTVIASQGWAAEVLAKAVLLRGSDHPFDLLGGTGAEALVVTRDREVAGSPGLAPFLAGRPLPARLVDERALVG